MKQWFFTFVAIGIPVFLVIGLIYMFARGVYTVISDWRMDRELNQLRKEAAIRRQQRGHAPAAKPVDTLSAIEQSWGLSPTEGEEIPDALVFDLPDEPIPPTGETVGEALATSLTPVEDDQDSVDQAEATSDQAVVDEPENSTPQPMSDDDAVAEKTDAGAADSSARTND